MKRNMLLTLILIAGGIALMGQSSSCSAPMDATGDYSGTWSFDITDDNGTVTDTVDCSLSMNLEQDILEPPPVNLNVTGILNVDFSCFEEIPDWPDWATIPEPDQIQVTGTMDNNGKLTLISAGCTTGACVILILEGMAESDAGDPPMMERYSGQWGLGIGIAFLPAALLGGRFEVLREE